MWDPFQSFSTQNSAFMNITENKNINQIYKLTFFITNCYASTIKDKIFKQVITLKTAKRKTKDSSQKLYPKTAYPKCLFTEETMKVAFLLKRLIYQAKVLIQ